MDAVLMTDPDSLKELVVLMHFDVSYYVNMDLQVRAVSGWA